MPVRRVFVALIRLICLLAVLALAYSLGRWLREPTLDGGIVLLAGVLACGYVVYRLIGPRGVAGFGPHAGTGRRSASEAAPAAAAAGAAAPDEPLGPDLRAGVRPAARKSSRARARREAERARDAVAPETAPSESSTASTRGGRARRREAERALESLHATEDLSAAAIDPPSAPAAAVAAAAAATRGDAAPPAAERGDGRGRPPAGQGAPSPAAEPAPPGRALNINTATAEELAALRGVGPVAAQRILDDREANGPYSSLEALARVEGFAGSRIARLRAQGVHAE